jgi:DNA polymerase III subunit gamma/tau
MSYLVLARKYRPQNFDEVYAQDHITTILKNAIALNRLAHAFLFTGSRGVGKTSMARILAKSLNCMEGLSPKPCNKCENCLEITQGTSTDVVEIDGASNTGVDDIRDLQKELMYSTSKSRYKIFIIDEVHMLSKSAFNALLKTLEEPPPQVMFIFATTEPHKVLPTIISRCQRYDFKRIPVESIVKRLEKICEEEGLSFDREAFYLVAKKADGSMRDAMSLMDQLIALGKKNISSNDVLSLFGIVSTDVYQKITGYISEKEPAAIISMLHSLLDKGNDLQEFINGYLDYLRTLLLIKSDVPLPEVTASVKENASSVIDKFSVDSLLYLLSVLIKTKTDIKYSVNPILMAEMTFIKLSRMEDMMSISSILNNWNGEAEQSPRRVAPISSNNRKPIPQNASSTVKSASVQEKPVYTEINAEIFNKKRDFFLQTLQKTQPFTANFLSNTELQSAENNFLVFVTSSDAAFDYLNKEKEVLTSTMSDFFNKEVKLDFRYQKKEDDNYPKLIRNPSYEDITRESPNLAKLIDSTNATVKQVLKKQLPDSDTD